MHLVLIIEDNAADAKLAGAFLSKNFALSQAGTIAGAVDLLDTIKPDAILLDLTLPDSHGLDTLVELCREYPGIPIVVWTGAGTAAEAIKNGAEDFILKGINDFDAINAAITKAIARHKFAPVQDKIHTLERLINGKKDKPSWH